MHLEEGQEIFNEIIELCYQINDLKLIDFVEAILPETESSTDISQLVSTGEELIITLNEIEFTDEEEDIVKDIMENIEKLSE